MTVLSDWLWLLQLFVLNSVFLYKTYVCCS